MVLCSIQPFVNWVFCHFGLLSHLVLCSIWSFVIWSYVIWSFVIWSFVIRSFVATPTTRCSRHLSAKFEMQPYHVTTDKSAHAAVTNTLISPNKWFVIAFAKYLPNLLVLPILHQLLRDVNFFLRCLCIKLWVYLDLYKNSKYLSIPLHIFDILQLCFYGLWPKKAPFGT